MHIHAFVLLTQSPSVAKTTFWKVAMSVMHMDRQQCAVQGFCKVCFSRQTVWLPSSTVRYAMVLQTRLRQHVTSEALLRFYALAHPAALRDSDASHSSSAGVLTATDSKSRPFWSPSE